MIGVFDSGSGGLSVLQAIRTRVPRADIVYFGDLKNAPYGNKNRGELNRLTASGFQILLEHGATHIVSACNSVSVSSKCSCEACRLPYDDLIEMVGPTTQRFKNIKADVLVLATKATIESEIYQDSFKEIGIKADGVVLPDLVHCIEHGAEELVMQTMIREVLEKTLKSEHTHVILGCTHFPLVRTVFENVLESLGRDVLLVDPAEAVADAVVERFDTTGQGTLRMLVSTESPIFESFVHTLFPGETQVVEVV